MYVFNRSQIETALIRQELTYAYVQYPLITHIRVDIIADDDDLFEIIRNLREETKFDNSNDDEIISVLSAFSSVGASVVTVEVDKYDYRPIFHGRYENDLYIKVLSELLDKVFRFIRMHDVNLFIDRSTFIRLNELRTISADYSKIYGCHLERC